MIKHKPKQEKIVYKKEEVLSKKVVSVSGNVCINKNVCQMCNRGDRYGIPLIFVVHYDDKSINTVCYRCGANAARKEGLKLPLTEAEVYSVVEAKDAIKTRNCWRKMEEKEKKKNER